MTQQKLGVPAEPACDECNNGGIIIIANGDATFVQKCSCGCTNGHHYMSEIALYAAPHPGAGRLWG